MADSTDNDSYSSDGALHLSCESSDFDDSDNEVANEGSHCGVLPYQFEPYDEEEVEDSENDDQAEVVDGQANRIGNTDWCTCGNCHPMSTMTESVCCRDIHQVDDMRNEVPDIGCILDHPGFDPVCLNVHVLRTAYYAYRQRYGEEIEDTPERHRYVAYRQLVRWCFGYLGRQVRVPIPSCIVSKIRNTFPAEGDAYTGFQEAA